MENSTDIKAIKARLLASGLNNTDGPSEPPARSEPPGRAKPPFQPNSSTGIKKPPFESFSGNQPPTRTPKPLNTPATNTHTFGNETNRPAFPHKVQIPTKPYFSEIKDLATKPPFPKPLLTSSDSDLKPAFPKPPQVLNAKPSWLMNKSGSSPPPKFPVPNQMSSSRLWQQSEEKPNHDAPKKFPPSTTAQFKPHRQSLQSNFTKDTEVTVDAGTIEGGNKTSFPPPLPAASKKPSMKIKHSFISDSGPKQKVLPHPMTLGPAPMKPQRPPNVNLDIFTDAEASNGSHVFNKTAASNVSNHGPPGRPSPGPSLPQRHGLISQEEEIYDDLDESPPPLPPMTSHPSQGPKEPSDDDGEMYEFVEDRWDEQNIEKEKEEKEQMKRREAEKKEQKEREKKEQDARKKFKLVGPLTVIQQGKAQVDCKGSKTDLALKQGDSLDIIRIQGNPEGKWLGRNQEGHIGYVKTTSVKIDFDSLKNYKTQQAYDPDLYDDVEQASSDNSRVKGSGAEDDEIYDDVVDAEHHDSALPPCPDRNSDQQGVAVDEEIYDDVDSQSPPLLPPISSIPTLKNKNKCEEIDLKKQKKMEKEEKEFKKKFKYEGDIQVLNQVSVPLTMTNKKWSGKELPIKAGEKLDVIVKPVNNKMICRNAEGKFGYVSTLHIDTDDGEIYDDVGEDCIYDND